MSKKLFFISTLFLVIACGYIVYREHTTSADKLNIYVKPMPEPFTTLHPKYTRSRPDYMLLKNIFGQLIQQNEFGEITQDLASSWDSNTEGTKYIFKLNPNVYFHNGKKVTSNDVVFSINYLATKDSMVSSLLTDIVGYDDYVNNTSKNISGITAIDGTTVEFRLKTPTHVFLQILSDPKIVILPESEVSKLGDSFFEKPIGFGPYLIKDRDVKLSFIELIRYEQYHLTKSNISKIKLEMADKETAIKRFNDNAYNDLELYHLSDYDLKLITRTDIKQFSVMALSSAMLFFNADKAYFQKINTRSAIHNSIDILSIKNTCKSNIEPNAGLIPQGTIGWLEPETKSGNTNKQDIASNELPKSLTLLYYGEEIDPCIVEEIGKAISKKIKVQVHVIHTNQPEAVKKFINNDYDLLFDHLSMRGAEPIILLPYFMAGSNHNLIKFKDIEINKMYKKIQQTQSRGVRSYLYKEINKYISQEKKYIVPLFSDIRNLVFSDTTESDNVPAMFMLNASMNKVKQ